MTTYLWIITWASRVLPVERLKGWLLLLLGLLWGLARHIYLGAVGDFKRALLLVSWSGLLCRWDRGLWLRSLIHIEDILSFRSSRWFLLPAPSTYSAFLLSLVLHPRLLYRLVLIRIVQITCTWMCLLRSELLSQVVAILLRWNSRWANHNLLLSTLLWLFSV